MNDSKSIFASKSFWGAILTPVFAYIATRGFDIDGEAQAAIIGAASAIAGVVLRAITTAPVHVVKPE